MTIYLDLGVTLFCLTHLYPAIFITNRKAVIGKIGENPYKGIYTLLILLSLVMIVFGWRSSEVEYVFEPPEWGAMAVQILMLPMLFLFIASGTSSNIKRIIRHPQLSSILLWGVAHLLANGENRSIILFGTFSVWALIMMFFLNRRDGAWQKPDVAPLSRDIKVAVITLVIYAGLVYGHGYFTGISLIP